MADQRIELELLLLTEEATHLVNEANDLHNAAEQAKTAAMTAIARVELFAAFVQEFPQFLGMTDAEVPLVLNRHAQRDDSRTIPTGQYL